MKKIILFFTICFVLISSGFASPKLTLVTEKNPPYNFVKHGKVTGIAVDLIEEMLKGAKIPMSRKDILVDKWSSVFAQTISVSNTLLFSASRTKERENLFQWVGPIANIDFVIIAKKSKHLKMSRITDVAKYKIVTIKNSAPERAFVNMGGNIKKTIRVSTYKQAYKIIDMNRADAIVVDNLPFAYNLMKTNKPLSDYSVLFHLGSVDYYIVANTSTPKSTIDLLQEQLDKLKQIAPGSKTSKYEEINSKYFGTSKIF